MPNFEFVDARTEFNRSAGVAKLICAKELGENLIFVVAVVAKVVVLVVVVAVIVVPCSINLLENILYFEFT